MTEDCRLLQGGRGIESPIPGHIESPTWIVDKAWDKVSEVAYNALDAYMAYCKEENLPHSYLLGLDILITGVADKTGKKVVDIRPTLLEGPCCNSYPACPNFFSSRLYKKLKAETGEDLVEYPVHPTMIMDKIVEAYLGLWKARGHSDKPVVGIFTRPYAESEEETAHVLAYETFKKYGVNVFRITPDEKPYVKNGKIHVDGTAIDLCHRRIERIHVPLFYGEELGNQIINEATETIWINPWKIDDLRSKTIEEEAFRRWEKKGGNPISRPITLVGKEITPENVKKLLETGGYALKKWNSTGGKGVFLHAYMPKLKSIYDKLYLKYDGRNMTLIKDEKDAEKYLAEFEDFKEDAAIQQLRIIDARELDARNRLVYDTRINALYNEDEKKWHLISGISRSVPCGPDVANGNSLLTNVSSGAEISILIMGHSKVSKERMHFGPLLTAMVAGKTEYKI